MRFIKVFRLELKRDFINRVIRAKKQIAEQKKLFRLAGEKEKEGMKIKLKGQVSTVE